MSLHVAAYALQQVVQRGWEEGGQELKEVNAGGCWIILEQVVEEGQAILQMQK